MLLPDLPSKILLHVSELWKMTFSSKIGDQERRSRYSSILFSNGPWFFLLACVLDLLASSITLQLKTLLGSNCCLQVI